MTSRPQQGRQRGGQTEILSQARGGGRKTMKLQA
ncbi:hypothetical protein P368_23655 [Comamonas thiooxydans]|nr:hypothetical protein P369_22200 [Comamonas thiooxydans]KGG94271.1 hypothetical protein P367_22740 [Comamonas thiooxydans]KGG99593.1 hypothetical protein P365_21555 [Comamonas thiooxydans]KGH04907.1 hypothetical protein P368_23655 [Comamonas thiooxydans]